MVVRNIVYNIVVEWEVFSLIWTVEVRFVV